MNFQSFEFSCSFASLAAHAVWQLRYLLPVSCRCRVAVELVSLVLRAIAGSFTCASAAASPPRRGVLDVGPRADEAAC